MCDKCGNIFSEHAEGWQTYTATTRVKDSRGNWSNETVVMDACPDCSFQPSPTPTIRALVEKPNSENSV